MKKLSFLLVGGALMLFSCGKPTVSNLSANNQLNSSNSNYNQPVANNSNNILQIANRTPETNAQANAEVLKQIQSQQLETADPRRAANRNISANSNQPVQKNSGSSQRQTW